MKFVSHLSFSIAFLCCTPGLARAQETFSPWTLWQQGDVWKIAVELTRDKGTNEPRKGVVLVNVIGKKEINGIDCWILCFIPQEDMPAEMRQQYHVFVDKTTGFVRKIVSPEEPNEPEIALHSIPQGTFPAACPAGIPLEILPVNSPSFRDAKSPSGSISLQRQQEGPVVEVLLSITKSGREELSVRQEWVMGEKWWRTYQRHVLGQKSISAYASVPSVPQEEPAFDLRRDVRLHKRVSVQGPDLRLAEILETLRAAILVDLSLEPSLVGHDPTFGTIEMNEVPAWTVMNMIAEQNLVNGRWEPHAEGYHLTGQSDAILVAQRPAPNWSRYWTLAIGAQVALVIILWLLWRRRRQNVTSSQSVGSSD